MRLTGFGIGYTGVSLGEGDNIYISAILFCYVTDIEDFGGPYIPPKILNYTDMIKFS